MECSVLKCTIGKNPSFVRRNSGPKIHLYDTICSMITSKIVCFWITPSIQIKILMHSSDLFFSKKSFEKHYFTIQQCGFARWTDWGLPLSKMVGLASLSSKDNQVTYPDNSDCLTIELQYSSKLCADWHFFKIHNSKIAHSFQDSLWLSGDWSH